MIVFKLYYTPNSLKMTSEHKGGSHTGVIPSFVFNIDIFVFNIDLLHGIFRLQIISALQYTNHFLNYAGYELSSLN